MPRPLRVFVPGGIFHIYSRVARGEAVFDDRREAEAFLDAVRDVKGRDDFVVFAWCLMSNHYHLAVRSGSVPLWRSMQSIQLRVTKGFNRRQRVAGPLWQGRYRSRYVEDQSYLDALVPYIHLNPVAAGLGTDPARYRWSGHREVLGKVKDPLVDVDETLSLYGTRRDAARKEYVRSMHGGRDTPWIGEGPGRLPWWSGPQEKDDHLDIRDDLPHVDYLGRSTEPVRPPLDTATFVRRSCDALGVDVAALAGRGKSPALAEHRGLITLLGTELYGQRVRALAGVLDKHQGSLSYAASRFAERRRRDPDSRALFDRVDRAVRKSRSAAGKRRSGK
jgi:REP element-mobilizing transposase RayT